MAAELRAVCLKVITQHINENTPLRSLNARDRGEVCQALSVDLPLHVALALPLDDTYWRRRANAHFPPPHVSLLGRRPRLRRKVVRERSLTPQTPGRGKGQSPTARGTPTTPTTPTRTANMPPVNVLQGKGGWRRAYLEAFLAKTLSSSTDSKRSWKVLGPLTKLCAPFIHSLQVVSLAPAPPSKEKGVEGGEEERGSRDHLNLAEVIAALPHLERLSIRYQTVVEGGDLSWPDHGASLHDAELLSEGVTSSSITHLCVYESCLDDDRTEALLGGLMNHKTLTCLDLRHNLISCTSASNLRDVISTTSVTELYLQHNQIGRKGANILGKCLGKGPALETLVLDHNPVGGAGGVSILVGATEGGKMKVLSLAGCRLTDECWEPLVEVITSLPSCRYVCLAANPFTKKPPPNVLSAAEEATSGARVLLTNLDGTTYLLGHVKGGRQLPSPLQVLHDQIQQPITVAASQEDLAHYLPLHGLKLDPWDFTIEEELSGMCLFTKNSANIF